MQIIQKKKQNATFTSIDLFSFPWLSFWIFFLFSYFHSFHFDEMNLFSIFFILHSANKPESIAIKKIIQLIHVEQHI